MDTEQPSPNHAAVNYHLLSRPSYSSTQQQQQHEKKKHNKKLEIPPSSTSFSLAQQQQQQQYSVHSMDIGQVAQQYGMPWISSIDPAANTANTGNKDDATPSSTSSSSSITPLLTFMPFWKWQIDFMKQHLTNLRVLPLPQKELEYAESCSSSNNNNRNKNNQRNQRIYTLLCTSDEYRYIRLTVLDAGLRTQVFTSVWYPDPALVLLGGSDNNNNNNNDDDSLLLQSPPILGCDLLQFHQKRHVCICDFQPLQAVSTTTTTTVEEKKENNNKWEDLLKPIRSQYPSLQQPMSGRFYNPADSFFSSQMLLGRCNVKDEDNHNNKTSNDDDKSSGNNSKQASAGTTTTTLGDAHNMIFEDFMPAWQQYVQQHVQLIKSLPRRPSHIPTTLQQHAAYDTYAAVRDPAHGLLAAQFGKDFADQYVYDVLFPLCERPRNNRK